VSSYAWVMLRYGRNTAAVGQRCRYQSRQRQPHPGPCPGCDTDSHRGFVCETWDLAQFS
jgi:hypothetical protein